MVRRSRLGRLSRALSDSPRALEAHGADTRLTRLFVFCISAAMAAVGGAIVAGVTGSASEYQAGPFGYFTSLTLVAVLVFCGRLPLLSPLIAAVVLEVLKIYPPFNHTTFLNYQGVIFGVLAIGAAVVPGMTVPRLRDAASGAPSAARLGHGSWHAWNSRETIAVGGFGMSTPAVDPDGSAASRSGSVV